MRKLMWLTVGFTAACVAGAYLLSGIWLILIGLSCLISGAVMLFLRQKPAKIVAAVLLGCAVGFAWFWGFDSFYLATVRDYDGETVPLTITASDYS